MQDKIDCNKINEIREERMQTQFYTVRQNPCLPPATPIILLIVLNTNYLINVKICCKYKNVQRFSPYKIISLI